MWWLLLPLSIVICHITMLVWRAVTSSGVKGSVPYGISPGLVEGAPNDGKTEGSGPLRRYDVFISHRGRDALWLGWIRTPWTSDTKRGFVSFLHDRLQMASVTAFVDEHELQPGDRDAWATMQSCLRNSSIAVPVLHASYGNSKWCLKELALMVSTASLIVMPVFLDDEGTAVLKELKAGALRLQQAGKASLEDVKVWTAALDAVGGMTGWRLDQTAGFQAPLMKKIVKDILKRLDKPLLEVARHPVAIDERLKPILSALEHAQVVGLHGMGGIGKTTLAMALLNKLRSDYDSCCFLKVGQKADSSRLQQLQQQALADLCGLDSQHIASTEEGVVKLRDHLASGKKLLVIDDVWSEEQRDALLVGMGSGSRVILTTRRYDLLCCPEVQQAVEVHLLGAADSLMLLSWHAFLRPHPPPKFLKVAGLVAKACASLPLTLEVIGSYLWQRGDLRVWNNAIKTLQKGDAVCGTEEDRLFARLRLSYDPLHIRLKDRFLDVACVIGGINAATALCVWGDGSEQDIDILCDRSLLWVHDGQLTMHDQLAAMGRNLVSRYDRVVEFDRHVWDPATALEKLELCKARENPRLQGVVCGERTWDVTPSVLANLPSLRLLVLDKGVRFAESTQQQRARIRYLSTTAASLPAWLHLPELAVLKIPSMAACEVSLQGLCHLSGLQTLDLEGCESLAKLPEGLSGLCGLQTMILSGCSRLAALPEGVSGLCSLQTLVLQNCHNLRLLPQEMSHLHSLQTLDLRNCHNLRTLPQEMSNLRSLQTLDMRNCRQLAKLPAGVSGLSSLQVLNLRKCRRLAALPEGMSGLSSLQTLDLSGCDRLKTLPKGMGGLCSLQNLDLPACYRLATLPMEVSGLCSLQTLNLSACYRLATLPVGMSGLCSLQTLDLIGCTSLNRMPQELSGLSSLQMLHLRNCRSLSALPEGVSGLGSLRLLDLSQCGNLAKLPEGLSGLRSLQTLELSACRSLAGLPEGVSGLRSLQTLILSGCTRLAALPEGMSALGSLQTLSLSGCDRLTTLPQAMSGMHSLQWLNMRSCRSLVRLPEEMSGLRSLQTLDLSGCTGLAELPEGLSTLPSLRTVKLCGCTSLAALPEWVSALSSLQTLDLSGCTRLAGLPEGVSSLRSLQCLNLDQCDSLGSLPEGISGPGKWQQSSGGSSARSTGVVRASPTASQGKGHTVHVSQGRHRLSICSSVAKPYVAHRLHPFG